MTQRIGHPVHRRDRVAAMAVLGLSVAQLLVGAFAPGLEQFTGKAFGARLVAYPVMMLLAPVAYAGARRRRGGEAASSPCPGGGRPGRGAHEAVTVHRLPGRRYRKDLVHDA